MFSALTKVHYLWPSIVFLIRVLLYQEELQILHYLLCACIIFVPITSSGVGHFVLAKNWLNNLSTMISSGQISLSSMFCYFVKCLDDKSFNLPTFCKKNYLSLPISCYPLDLHFNEGRLK